jgi:hypothetical protein
VKGSHLGKALMVVVAAYFLWAVFGGGIFTPHSTNADNRNAVMRLHAAVNVGDDRDGVLQKYWSHRTRTVETSCWIARVLASEHATRIWCN